MAVTSAMWHFARGMAQAGKGNLEAARSERATFLATTKAMPAEAMYGPLNKASDVFAVATHVLEAQIAQASNDRPTAIKHLTEAAAGEDKLNYTEPPDWYPPVRPALGAVLMKSGDYAGAEKVFRADLAHNPRHGRSLYGLMESLKAQGKNDASRLIELQFKEAWKNAEAPLTMDQL
jgi:hypothetical protein